MNEDLKKWIKEVKSQIKEGVYEPDIPDVKMLIGQIERLERENEKHPILFGYILGFGSATIIWWIAFGAVIGMIVIGLMLKAIY